MSKPSGEKLADLTQSSWRPGVPWKKSMGSFLVAFVTAGFGFRVPPGSAPQKKNTRDLFFVGSCKLLGKFVRKKIHWGGS